MADFTELEQRMPIRRLLSRFKARKPPIVFEHSTVREVIDAMIQFEHSRVVYVVNEAGALTEPLPWVPSPAMSFHEVIKPTFTPAGS